MSVKKNQHFVPRFYLKYFSNSFLGKTLGIYNIPSDKYIDRGNLQKQASKEYFYGEDLAVEDTLAAIEAETAKLFRNICETGVLPPRFSEEHIVMLIFIMILSARTEQSADTQNETADKIFKEIFKYDSRVKDFLDQVVVGWGDNAPLVSIRFAVESIPVLFDLEFKLLVNRTDVPFITSDQPVVLYNQFLERRKAFGGITGYAVKGLQIFFPLNPWLSFVFYDTNVYGVGNKKDCYINITNTKDVMSLNLLQYANAYKNLYFNEFFTEILIQELKDKGSSFRKESLSNVFEYGSVEMKGSSLIHTFISDTRIRLNLSFIRELKKAKRYELGNKMTHIRNQELLDMTERELFLNTDD
ncbi:hypothetical protein YDYSG_56960 [Paenibacillus tyrfis]|uniref:DUF4238 domain-containing protein n=1 Tax=Paenibacillus tyrfis TaxID=1501230 RepID=UPI00249268F2|nr:DUF4238 domain-containing protein [Paenibacillus tyrfis]GLI09664.1 hypothetical protein YDYSG_56960 [Paenibacillus tyrfis]